jgi:hypothetical protein
LNVQINRPHGKLRRKSEIGLRILRLQKEFLDREDAESTASEFSKPEWAPRTEEAIAGEYEAALRELFAPQPGAALNAGTALNAT